MTIDLSISLGNQQGSLAAVCEALGHAGVNIEAACGIVVEDRAELHVLVADAVQATRALIDCGCDILAQRQMVTLPIENRPGAAATLLRRIADAGVSLDLVYTSLDGRLVLGADDPAALRAAIG